MMIKMEKNVLTIKLIIADPKNVRKDAFFPSQMEEIDFSFFPFYFHPIL